MALSSEKYALKSCAPPRDLLGDALGRRAAKARARAHGVIHTEDVIDRLGDARLDGVHRVERQFLEPAMAALGFRHEPSRQMMRVAEGNSEAPHQPVREVGRGR